MSTHKPVGKTQSQGWHIGVHRTLPVDAHQVWQLIMAALGLPEHASAAAERFTPGTLLTTVNGTQLEVRSSTPGRLLRMRWQPPDWATPSTLQIRGLAAKTGTTISIHHEWLANAEQREAMRKHWTRVLDDLKASLPDSKP